MTHIYLMRHGQAGPVANPGFPDSSRSLTPVGFNHIKTQAARLLDRAPDLARIYFSPYVRTKQTAALVNNVFNAEFKQVNDLVPGGNAELVLDMLSGVEEEILLVTHIPTVSDIASLLLSKNIPFHQGTCIKIERVDAFARVGTLAWSMDP